MKKVVISVFLFGCLAFAAFAQKADYFTFTVGSGAGYNINTQVVISESLFGIDYTFNDSFTGGFKFRNISGTNLNVMNITVIPVDKLGITLYTGAIPGGSPAFGLGVNYDIFAKKSGLFAKVALYFDWLASSTAGSPFDIAKGGVVLFGIKTQVGL
ncbi:MAG: hypothetical protein LDL24_07855 [Treponema sp.]|nr:hypothetical protein [Treponema sp.]